MEKNIETKTGNIFVEYKNNKNQILFLTPVVK